MRFMHGAALLEQFEKGLVIDAMEFGKGHEKYGVAVPVNHSPPLLNRELS